MTETETALPASAAEMTMTEAETALPASGAEMTMTGAETALPASGADEAAADGTVYEAEDGTLSGNTHVVVLDESASGGKCVEGFEADGDRAAVMVSVAADGFYDLDFRVHALGGYKENRVYADGEYAGLIRSEEDAFVSCVVPHVWMAAGSHEVAVEKYWGWIRWDNVTVRAAQPADSGIYDVSAALSDSEASENARRVWQYLKDGYGKEILSGQYCDGGIYGHEMAVIWKETGKFPAIVGLDMIEASPSRVENGSESHAAEYALEAWENNTLVTMCWHWNAPSKYLTGAWYSGFYKEYTDIDLDRIMNGGDEEGYELLLSDMDAIAQELTVLRDADVPVLWRPLHEASGGWFWWGDCSAQSYIALYRLMYEKFTQEYGLHNLIWVWNGQSPDWYPGDDVVDVTGEDIYPGYHVYTSQYQKFAEAVGDSGEYKIAALTENGCLFDPDLAGRDGAMWRWFCTWSGEFVTDSDVLNVYAETYTEKEMLHKVYDHDLVITRDELPDLKTYSIGES